jgi:hypothetical protein
MTPPVANDLRRACDKIRALWQMQHAADTALIPLCILVISHSVKARRLIKAVTTFQQETFANPKPAN